MHNTKKIIISGGGTGGHVFPAISIAQALKGIDPHSEILFVGATGKIEMQKVPQAGFKIIGLPIQGFQRKISMKIFTFFFYLIKSLLKAKKIIKQFKPNIVVGVGGYASGAILYAANKRKIPIVIQEQNSYPGITNKLLATKATKIFVAYQGMQHYFQKEKLILTGNPVRGTIQITENKEEALHHFNLKKNKQTILIVGGSLGASTINQSVLLHIPDLIKQNKNLQIIWQTGTFYYQQIKMELKNRTIKNIYTTDFLDDMNHAYSAADIIVSRAGAGTISELCIVGKPIILVPSPNVTEDHQTKNAMALVENNAAILIKDNEVKDKLIPNILHLLEDKEQQISLSKNIKQLAKQNASIEIAKEIIHILEENKQK